MKIEKIIIASLLFVCSVIIACSFTMNDNDEVTYTTEEILEKSPIKILEFG